MDRYHLTWTLTPTPFTSIFNNIDRALNWAGTQADPLQLDLVVIDLYDVPEGQLWDAHRMALAFGLNHHFHNQEYLFSGGIEQERILAVLPVGLGQIGILVYLGELCVPAAFIKEVGSTAEEVKEAVAIEVYMNCGCFDLVRIEQTMHALFRRRFDDKYPLDGKASCLIEGRQVRDKLLAT